jgi:hypothetical protein
MVSTNTCKNMKMTKFNKKLKNKSKSNNNMSLIWVRQAIQLWCPR